MKIRLLPGRCDRNIGTAADYFFHVELPVGGSSVHTCSTTRHTSYCIISHFRVSHIAPSGGCWECNAARAARFFSLCTPRFSQVARLPALPGYYPAQDGVASAVRTFISRKPPLDPFVLFPPSTVPRPLTLKSLAPLA